MTDTGNGIHPEPTGGASDGSGEPTARPPSWPGVTRPAGWFLPQEPVGEQGPEPADAPRHPDATGHADANGHADPEWYEDPKWYEDARDDDGYEYEYEGDTDRPGELAEQVAGQWFVAGEAGATWYEDDDDDDDGSWSEPVVGPTGALRGRPGGPGFAVPPGTVPGLSDQRSPWEQSQDVWTDSGVSWERGEGGIPAMGQPPSYRAPAAFGRQGDGPGGWPQAPAPNGAAPNGTAPNEAAPYEAGPNGAAPYGSGLHGTGPFGAWPQATRPQTVWQPPDQPLNSPLSAPTMADVADVADETYAAPFAPEPPAAPVEPPPSPYASYTRPAAPASPYARPAQYAPQSPAGWPTRQDAPGAARRTADQGYDAVRSPRPRYPDLPQPSRARKVRRRRGSLGVVKVGVPAVVIVAVGAVAIMMLTGRTPTVLAERANQTSPPKAAGQITPSAKASTAMSSSMIMATFPGYPGKPSSAAELVDGIAANGATVVAVGTVDGYPAAWQRAANGAWILETGPETVGQGTYALSSVAQGGSGWVAVGGPTGASAPQPVVLISTDGRTWQAVDGERSFGTEGEHIYGAAAGPEGYVVVGKINFAGRTYAADWWSTNLRDWVRGDNGGLDGRLASSEMFAAAGTPGGFVAVGQHAGHPAAWMAGNTLDWMLMDLSNPAGSSSASLTQVVSHGNRVVALGQAVTSHGTMPFAAVSSDGGASWTETDLPTVGGASATVTAITATASQFVAAGQIGQNTVYWTSQDGTDWSSPTQISGIGSITSLAATSSSQVTGTTTMPGGHPALVTIP